MGLDGYRICLSRLQLQSWISTADRKATLLLSQGVPETVEKRYPVIALKRNVPSLSCQDIPIAGKVYWIPIGIKRKES